MDVDLPSSIQAKLKSDTGEEAGGTLDIPLTVTKDQLQLICNALLEEVSFYLFCYTNIPLELVGILLH